MVNDITHVKYQTKWFPNAKTYVTDVMTTEELINELRYWTNCIGTLPTAKIQVIHNALNLHLL